MLDELHSTYRSNELAYGDLNLIVRHFSTLTSHACLTNFCVSSAIVPPLRSSLYRFIRHILNLDSFFHGFSIPLVGSPSLSLPLLMVLSQVHAI